MVHRDIKPDNCLLTEDDTLKIVDFGVSEMFESPGDMKIAKSAGSPAFMAPELCTIKHGDVYGKPADIWSMGVTLYCLRFGRVPFQKSAVLDLYDAIVNDDVNIPEGCGEGFADLMNRMLQKDPAKRITMEQLRVCYCQHDFEAILTAILGTSMGNSPRPRSVTTNEGKLFRYNHNADRGRKECCNYGQYGTNGRCGMMYQPCLLSTNTDTEFNALGQSSEQIQDSNRTEETIFA